MIEVSVFCSPEYKLIFIEQNEQVYIVINDN